MSLLLLLRSPTSTDYTGTADVSGSGSLTATGVAAYTGAAALSGSGSLTTARTVAVTGSASLSGSGTDRVGSSAITAAGTATTTTDSNSSINSITTSVPAGVIDGDLLMWVIVGNLSSISTPAGWTAGPSSSQAALGIFCYYRTAASEPASYTSSGMSYARYTASMHAFRGVNATPMDATATTASGTTIVQPPAISTVTDGAWVFDVVAGLTASGVTNTTWASSNTTLEAQATYTAGAYTNPTHAVGHSQVSPAGSFTGAFTATNTFSASVAVSAAIRPLGGTSVIPGFTIVGSTSAPGR